VGARNDTQIADTLQAAELELTADERKKLDDVSRPTLLYPYWHQRNTAAARLGEADRTLIDQYR
jgi:hypothetical protein